MDREKIYNIEVYAETKMNLMKEITERLNKKETFTVMSVNPEIILLSQKNSEVRHALETSQINIPDGFGTLVLAKKKGKQIKERIAGFDLFKETCALAEKRGEAIFLYGAEKWVVEKTAEQLKQEFPLLKIAGIENGYTPDRAAVAQKIANSNATYLFIALGAPYQEAFIAQQKNKLNVKMIQPVGGSFDVVAGKAKRAPLWVQKINLEWFYRLVTDLKRTKRVGTMLWFVGRELVKRG